MKNNLNIKELLKQRWYLVIGLVLVVALVLFLPKTFSQEVVVKSINITSNNTSFENKDGGSFNIEKSAEWTGYKKARVTFDVDTVGLFEETYTDIVFVLDVSGSMTGEKIERVKSDASELVDTLLSNPMNRAALITFETNSSIVVGDLTNVREVLLKEINNLTTGNMTNYYQALKNVDEVLDGYEKEDNRELIVLFLTDGYPNQDIPNEVGEYAYLKSKYPYMTINGVQYEMGSAILDPIVKISDNQFIADMETLNNVLFEAALSPISYDEFTIVDYINDEYFDIESVDNIDVTTGEVNLEGNKVTWNLAPFKSGSKAKMTIDLTLKDEFVEKDGYYPTNKGEEVKTKIEEIKEDITTPDTPVLKSKYDVIYDGNAPSDCTVENVPGTESYLVYSTVEKSSEVPICSGYQFKGWKVVTDDVEKVNDDYFIMPGKDVVIRAVWSKLTLSKTVDGEVYKVPDYYHYQCDDNTLSCHIAKTHFEDASLIYHSKEGAKINDALVDENGDLCAMDDSYRYAGASNVVNNYVCFGSDEEVCPVENMYRIIGVFNVADENEDDRYQVKLIKYSILGAGYWSGSNSNQSNDWRVSTLNTVDLNQNYLNNLGDKWNTKIASHVWNINGTVAYTTFTSKIYYSYENEKVSSALLYEAKVGLMYVSDFGYAVSSKYWSTPLYEYNNSDIVSNNWLKLGIYEWTLTKYNASTSSLGVYIIEPEGNVKQNHYAYYSTLGVRPVFYLESNVELASGSGTASDPYRIS